MCMQPLPHLWTLVSSIYVQYNYTTVRQSILKFGQGVDMQVACESLLAMAASGIQAAGSAVRPIL